LLSYHPSPDRRAPNGDTALHLAARWGLTNAIAFLLNAGFSPDLTNADGLTPLQAIAGAADDAAGQRLWAARSFRGSPPGVLPQTVDEAADFLLSRGATLDVFCAAGLGRNVDLEAMLRTNRALVNARDGLGRTPLHYAVARSSQLSISGIRGAALVLGPPSARSNQTATALRLLRAHANPAAATLRSIPSLHRDEIAPAGTTPLHFAARLGNEDLIRALLEAGAPAASMDQAGETPLHAAARLWLTNGAARLLSAHAPLNVANHAGRTPLRIAVESRGAAMAQVLLDAGASPDVGLEHDTLAHLAAENGDTATLAVLLAHGLRLEARDWTGATPFQRAAVAHQCDTLAWLRARGADVNATDLRGNTALHLLAADAFDIVQHQAAQPWWVRWMRHSLTGPGITGKALIALINAKILSPPPPPVWTNSSLSSWLIAHRANPSMANDAGQTPLHLLCGQPWAANNPAVVSNRLSILLQAGARLDQADAQGRTPIQIATSNLPPELAQWLLFRAGNRQEEKPR